MVKIEKLSNTGVTLVIWTKKMSIIRKYHKHKLQTNPCHREEEPHNNHETPEIQTKQSNQLSLSLSSPLRCLQN